MGALEVDRDTLEAVAASLDLRQPNKEAIESVAFEIAQHYDVDGKPRPFEGVVDSATGVGKTYVFAGAMEYFAQVKGVRNFVLIAPSRVILNKTIEQFTAGHGKSLLNDISAPVTLVTVDNFDSPAMASIMDDESRVKVYIFTVQALLRPKKKTDRRTHTFQEGLGAGLYERLQSCEDLTIFADEHHAYYGPEFSTAIRDLQPWALIGLTETPHKRTPEKEHPRDASFSQPSSGLRGVRRSESGVLRGPGASGRPGRAVWPDRPGRQQAHTARAGWGERAPEGPRPGRRDGRWCGQHR